MDVVTIDFETFYSKEFSLSKMTTEAYIRDDQFEVIGVGIKVNNLQTDWYTGSDPGGFLNSLDYSDKAILCHNTAFDGAILSWHFGIKPKFWFDTLSMARPGHQATVGGSLKNLVLYYHLGGKGTEVIDALGKRRKDFTPAQIKAYGGYCCNDVELTYKLFKKLSIGFPTSELLIIDQTLRMYTEPQLELDRISLEKHLAAEQNRKKKLLQTLSPDNPEQAQAVLRSNPKFAGLLRGLGAQVPMKLSPRTGKVTYAFAKTDQGLLDLQDHAKPAVRAVVEARLGVKTSIEETRTQRLIEVSNRGPLPIMLNYYGAHTGRFSGGDKLNLQNLPARKGNAIRTAICAPEGHKLIACDSSQIEARILAYIADQKDLVEAFRQGRDVYSEFASLIYGRPITKADIDERFVGKTCILGLGYGMGWERFKDTVAQGGVIVGESEAKRIVYLYRNHYPRVQVLWNMCDAVLKNMLSGTNGLLAGLVPYTSGGLELPNSMKIRYHALRSTADGFSYIADKRAWMKYTARVVTSAPVEDAPWTNIYGGKVTENVVQALARIIIADQMVAIGQHYPVVLQVHDENVICPRTAEVNAAQQLIERVMSTPPVWAPSLPIACESGVGGNYGEAK